MKWYIAIFNAFSGILTLPSLANQSCDTAPGGDFESECDGELVQSGSETYSWILGRSIERWKTAKMWKKKADEVVKQVFSVR